MVERWLWPLFAAVMTAMLLWFFVLESYVHTFLEIAATSVLCRSELQLSTAMVQVT